jgi:hypothetical protein
VKCDEKLPHCHKCTATGRKCEYAAVSTPHGTFSLTFVNYTCSPSHSLSNLPDTDSRGKRALSYFQHRAALELGGVCFPDLWSKFVLPASQHDSTIRHAVVALVTLHEEHAALHETKPVSSQYASRHYKKAVNDLLQLDVSARPDAAQLALVSCIIFASIEILRGHYHPAFTHLLSGKRMLEEQHRNGTNHRPQLIPLEVLEDIFQRIESQTISIGDSSVMHLPLAVRRPEPAISARFESISDAFYALETLQNHMLHFFWHGGRVLNETNEQPEVYETLWAELNDFKVLFERWKESFNRLLDARSAGLNIGSEGKEPALLLLNILRTGFEMIFTVNRPKRDCDLDGFTYECAKMVDWAEAYIKATSHFIPAEVSPDSGGSTASSKIGVQRWEGQRTISADKVPPRKIISKPDPIVAPTFSMSTGIIPSLWMCGARCRDPQVRRKALRLLQTCNRREGLWDSNVAAGIIDVLIRLEEGNALREMKERGCPVERVTDASQVSKNARVVVLGLEFRAERTGELAYRTMEPCIEGDGEQRMRVVKEMVRW